MVNTPFCLPGRNVVGCPRSAGEGKNRLSREPGLSFTGIITVYEFGFRYPHVAVQLPSGFLTGDPSWMGKILRRFPGSVAVAVGVWVGLGPGPGVKVGVGVSVGPVVCVIVKVGVPVEVAVGELVLFGWRGFGVEEGAKTTGLVAVGTGTRVRVAVWVGVWDSVFVEVGMAGGIAVLVGGGGSVGVLSCVTSGSRVLVGMKATFSLVGVGINQMDPVTSGCSNLFSGSWSCMISWTMAGSTGRKTMKGQGW